MSYLRKFQYKIEPQESYTINRHCPICGIKSSYANSNNFRVNANGNRIDVWLIYQCVKCKHTYNLAIHERVRKEDFSSLHYNAFMENDKDLAMKYGLDKSVFSRNKAEIDRTGIKHLIIPINSHNPDEDEQILHLIGDSIEIENPYGLKIRTEKLIAETLHISRKQAKQLKISGVITLNNYPDRKLELLIKGDIYNEYAL